MLQPKAFAPWRGISGGGKAFVAVCGGFQRGEVVAHNGDGEEKRRVSRGKLNLC